MGPTVGKDAQEQAKIAAVGEEAQCSISGQVTRNPAKFSQFWTGCKMFKINSECTLEE